METHLDAKAYRTIAMEIEKDLQELMAYSERVDEASVPVVGNSNLFPSLSPEMRTLGQQLSLAQDQAIEAIAILNTLAELKDAENREDDVIAPVPPILIAQMESQVESFVNYYNTKNAQRPDNQEKKEKRSEENNQSSE